MFDRDQARNRAILVVEDDRSVGAALCATIESIGYVCTVASDIPSAVQLLGSRAFVAMILDLQLGDDRGEDLIQRLNSAGIALPPLIIVSGRPNSELRVAGRITQAAAWLKKPFSVESLIAAIEIAIEWPSR